MFVLMPKAKPESVYFFAALWHEPCMAQCAQFAPQVDLPCFLHFLKYTTIAAITAIKTRATTIVDRFSAKNVNMINPPCSVFSICEKQGLFQGFFFFGYFNISGKFAGFLVRLEQLIEDADKKDN